MKRITLPGFKEGETVILNDGEFVARWETCPWCNGRGKTHSDNGKRTCGKCNGTGRVAVPVEEDKKA